MSDDDPGAIQHGQSSKSNFRGYWIMKFFSAEMTLGSISTSGSLALNRIVSSIHKFTESLCISCKIIAYKHPSRVISEPAGIAAILSSASMGSNHSVGARDKGIPVGDGNEPFYQRRNSNEKKGFILK